jgi:hypothetical protein
MEKGYVNEWVMKDGKWAHIYLIERNDVFFLFIDGVQTECKSGTESMTTPVQPRGIE